MHVFYKTKLGSDVKAKLQLNQIEATDDLEIFPVQPFYSIKNDGKLTVFRFDANHGGGVTFDITGSEGVTTVFRMMHRGKLILTQTSNEPHLSHISNNMMLLRMPFRVMSIYLRDDSDLIFLLLHSQKEVIVVNTKSLVVERLVCNYEPEPPNLPAWDFAQADIVSVREGVLTYTLGPQKDIFYILKTGPRQLWRAKLPAHLM
ncbi:hypothetical protein PENTCL1PPCAC_5958, partial [Pristionchus entomophagus]